MHAKQCIPLYLRMFCFLCLVSNLWQSSPLSHFLLLETCGRRADTFVTRLLTWVLLVDDVSSLFPLLFGTMRERHRGKPESSGLVEQSKTDTPVSSETARVKASEQDWQSLQRVSIATQLISRNCFLCQDALCHRSLIACTL